MVQFRFETGFNKTFKPLMDAYHERKGPSSRGTDSQEINKSKYKSISKSSGSLERSREIVIANEESDEDESLLLKKAK
jgi:hypothetical protein